jgi:hypothetical protein
LGIGGTTPAILSLAGGECSVSGPHRFTSFETTPTPIEQEVVADTSRLDDFENGKSLHLLPMAGMEPGYLCHPPDNCSQHCTILSGEGFISTF